MSVGDKFNQLISHGVSGSEAVQQSGRPHTKTSNGSQSPVAGS